MKLISGKSVLRCACAAALAVGLIPTGALAQAEGSSNETPPHRLF